MKEDQTQLITARMEHLQFMMDSGKMPIFRHRSDMFLFALEAHNIARGLSSRYFRMQEDLDIRFFVRFQFDYWLSQVQSWIRQLDGAEYRVEDDDFFAEGRAKRLTIVIDRLFGYHLDKLPADSAQGSMPLPDEEILEPLRKIQLMQSTSLVASFRDALREVHTYLTKLSMMPLEWSSGERQKALNLYLSDASQSEYVIRELSEYDYFCHMPDGKSVKSQFCYLKRRIAALASNGEVSGIQLSKSDCEALLKQLTTLFGKEETHPSADEITANSQLMADDGQFARFLYFVRMDDVAAFPALNTDMAVNYLIRKDVTLTETQEHNLQALFALMQAMRGYFDPILKQRHNEARHTPKLQDRIDSVLAKVRHCNSLLAPLLGTNRKPGELDAFFSRLFSPEWLDDHAKGIDELLKNFENGIGQIKLKTYIQVLRQAVDSLHILAKTTAPGKQIYDCLKGNSIVSDVNPDTVQSYYSKTDYKSEPNWRHAIRLVAAVVTEYKKS